MLEQKGMTTTVVASIVGILLLLGGGWYLTTMNKTSDTSMVGEEAMMEGASDTMMKDDASDTIYSDDTMMKGDVMMDASTTDTMMKTETSFRGAVIAGASSPLLEYNQRDYESAQAQGRVVVLYFYANWCPICKAEFIDTKAAFDELTGNNIVGFRVHFNDNETTKEMEELARTYGVAYQHTKVFIKHGERILKSPESWSKARYMSEFAAAIN